MELDFHPLSICEKVAPLMNEFMKDSELSHYVKPLHQVILTKLLQQLSRVYSTIKIESVVALAKFPAPYNYNRFDIEKFVVHGSRGGMFKVRIDHANETFVFETEEISKSSFPVTQLRNRLEEFSHRLSKVADLIDSQWSESQLKKRQALFAEAWEKLESDRELTEERRRKIIENAEKQQDYLKLKEQERQQRVVELQQAEEARLAEHEKMLMSQRLEQQRKEIERNEELKSAKKLVEELRALGIKINDEDLENTDRLREIQSQHIEKQRRDLEVKARSLAKKIDHTVRAFSKEEIPLLEKDYQDQRVKDLKEYEATKENIINDAKEAFEKNLAMKKSLAHVMEDYAILRKKLSIARDAEYEKLKKEAIEKIEKEKQERRAKHEEERAAQAKKEEELLRKKQGIFS